MFKASKIFPSKTYNFLKRIFYYSEIYNLKYDEISKNFVIF